MKRGIWALHEPCTVEREAASHLPGIQISLQVYLQTSHHSSALHTTGLINLTCTFSTTTCGGRAPQPSSFSQVLLCSHHSFPNSVPEDCPAQYHVHELQRHCASSAPRPWVAATCKNFKLWMWAIIPVNLTRLVICFKIFTCLQDCQLQNH